MALSLYSIQWKMIFCACLLEKSEVLGVEEIIWLAKEPFSYGSNLQHLA
jgi:hypothetical protein